MKTCEEFNRDLDQCGRPAMWEVTYKIPSPKGKFHISRWFFCGSCDRAANHRHMIRRIRIR